ncbi:MAG: orc1/cdc6 family replication initiation protein [Candidatus Thermoplasmatota archaeon]|jgi:cell division control protein 6|nr:orc1/cdc6 family replication initiation protein [Candidatus Thermoplasmatota archaeon]
MGTSSKNLFEKFNHQSLIVKGQRQALEPGFVPERLPHREEEAEQLAEILSPSLKNFKPSNVIIFGKPGVGKTSVVKFVENEMIKAIQSSLDTKIKIIDVNCGIVDNPYGVLLAVGDGLLDTWEEKLPFTGWPLDKLYNTVVEKINNFAGIAIIVLDEIDKLVRKSGDSVLYQLLRINEIANQGRVCILGISNDLRFTEYLDPRVKSRLIEETMVYNPYNATQIYDILRDRSLYAGIADSIDESAMKTCAALAAQEHGDARRAIDMLRIAVELTEKGSEGRILDDTIYEAKRKLERDVVVETVSTLPLHSKLVLFSIALIDEIKNGGSSTMGEFYDLYEKIADRMGVSSLTQRRVADIIGELSNLGLTDSKVQSFGRYGRTTTATLNYGSSKIKEILIADEMLSQLKDVKPMQKSLPVS